MGIFSNILRTVVDDWLGIDLPTAPAAPPDNSAAIQKSLTEQTNALKAQTDNAQKATDAALAAQKAALLKSDAALIPNIDSESARTAQDTRKRKLQSTSPWGIGLQNKLGAAPTGFRILSGQ